MILVTGGTGVMGSALVRRLAESGEQVRVLTLPGDAGVKRVDEWCADVRFGDIASAESVRGLCDRVRTVYHLAAVIITGNPAQYDAVNVRGTRAIVEAARAAGVRHLVHVSSASVTYPRPTPYSLSKRSAEEIVRKSGLNWTIVRPTLVYDKKGGQEFDQFLEYLKKFPVVPFIGRGGALKRPVWVGDIIDGLVRLNNEEKAYGKTYNFSGGEAISIRDFTRLCLDLSGRADKRIVTVPVWLCRAAAWVLERFAGNPPLRWPVIAGVTQDANLDPAEAVREIGYAPKKVREQLPLCFPRS